MTPFPDQQFDVILADPPWSYTGAQDKWGAASKFYATMTDREIYRLPVGQALKPHGVVFLWATCPKLHKAVKCLRKWELHFRGVAFVWVKTSKDGVPFKARGVRPSVVKPLTELVLVGSRIAKGRPMPIADEGIVQTVFAPLREHSRKPDEVQERIEMLYPEATRLELFARHRRPGWSAWGLEVEQEPPVTKKKKKVKMELTKKKPTKLSPMDLANLAVIKMMAEDPDPIKSARGKEILAIFNAQVGDCELPSESETAAFLSRMR